MIPNLHALEDSWWDGPERFQYVNRNVITQVQNEDLFKFTKTFSPKFEKGLHIGGWVKESGRANWPLEGEPLTILMELNTDKPSDIYGRAEQLPFQDKVFGYIVSFHVFEHIRGDLKETIREWLRVLVDNGLIALSMPNKEYFLHDPNQTEDGVTAYHEMAPMELFEIIKDFAVDILLFDSRENNFDFDILMRKRSCESFS